MNVNCNICSELFLPQSKIYAAPCGHTFHDNCLLIWLERSETCPTCRVRTTPRNILRIYLNLLASEGNTQNSAVLQLKVDNLEFQLKLKEKEIENKTKHCTKYKEQTRGLREEIKRLEDEIARSKFTMDALQSRILDLKSRAKEAARAQEEIVNLKKKIDGLEKTSMVLTASKEEVQDMIKRNNDYDTLCLLVTTLKKTLVDYERRTKDLERTLKTSRKDITVFKTQVEAAKEENQKLLAQAECHKTCEAQRLQMKRKIEELQEGRAANSSTVRIISESPAPLKKMRTALEAAGENVDSPTIEEQVKEIKFSDSPYLRYKSSSLGFLSSALVGASRTPGKFSISKDAVMDVEKTKITKPDVVFNGLGGHCKMDDDFCMPRKLATASGVRRYKSTSKASSGKAKKLAPLPTIKGEIRHIISLLPDDDDPN